MASFFLDPLGDSDAVYQEAYAKMHEDFMARAKRFGCEHKKSTGFKIRARQSDTIQEQTKRDVTDRRTAEWNTYKVYTENNRNLTVDTKNKKMLKI